MLPGAGEQSPGWPCLPPAPGAARAAQPSPARPEHVLSQQGAGSVMRLPQSCENQPSLEKPSRPPAPTAAGRGDTRAPKPSPPERWFGAEPPRCRLAAWGPGSARPRHAARQPAARRGCWRQEDAASDAAAMPEAPRARPVSGGRGRGALLPPGFRASPRGRGCPSLGGSSKPTPPRRLSLRAGPRDAAWKGRGQEGRQLSLPICFLMGSNRSSSREAHAAPSALPRYLLARAFFKL